MKVKVEFSDKDLELIISALGYGIQYGIFQDKKEEMQSLKDRIKLTQIINK